jgi:hypothetical protein
MENEQTIFSRCLSARSFDKDYLGMNIAVFLEPVTAQELCDTYIFDHARLKGLLQDLRNESTKVEINDPDRMGDSNRVMYNVSFYLSNGELVLDQALQRWLLDNKQCLGQPGLRSKVAYRLKFYCRPPLQHGGLATQLLAREEAVFKKWGAREVQVLAMDSGRWIWTLPQFGYKIAEFDMHNLRQQFVDWQRFQGRSNIKRANTLGDFPRDFLETAVNSVSLFKVL